MNPAPASRKRTATATAAGAVAFAALGLLGSGPDATWILLLTSAAGVAAVLLVAGGVAGFRAAHRGALGRLGAWGAGLVTAGLAATALGFLVNATGPLLPEGAAGTVALVGVPAWSLAHLVYVGATVLGAACLRVPAVPRPLAVLLTAALPLMAAGVGIGLALGGTAATLVTWAATEGQAGLAWLLIGLHLRAGRVAEAPHGVPEGAK